MFKTSLHILILLLFLLPSKTYSQTDTLYLGNRKKNIVNIGDHIYTRVITKIATNVYYIKDFAKDSILNLTAYSRTPDLENIFKEYNWYGSSPTVLLAKKYTSSNSGCFLYYNDEGVLATKSKFTQGKENGKAIFYDKQGKILRRAKNKNGKPYTGIFPTGMRILTDDSFHFFRFNKGVVTEKQVLFKNRLLAAKYIYAPESKTKPISAQFYDYNENLIGSCLYSNGKPVDGIFVEYFGTSQYIKRKTTLVNSETKNDVFYDSEYNIIGQCNYINNKRHSGKYFKRNQLITYLNGEQTGEVSEYTNSGKLIYNYSVDNRRKEGGTSFHYLNPNSPITGEFKDGRPWSGKVFYKNDLCEYIDGAKNGQCLTFNNNMEVNSKTTYIMGTKQDDE